MKTASFHLLRRSLLAAALCFALPVTVHADLVGYWSLDGDADADAGGWGASTVQTGANGENDISYPADVPAAISSRVSQSLAFDANNDDRIVTGFNAGTAGISGTPAITISFWIKQTVNTLNERTLVYLGDGSTDKGAAFIMERRNDNLRVDFFNGIHRATLDFESDQFGFQTSQGARFVDDQWLHVGVTYLRVGPYSFPRVYIDGVEVSGKTYEAYQRLLNLAEDAVLTLGDSVSGDDAAAGFQLAELAVWDEALPEHRIMALSNGYTPLDIFIQDCDKDGIDDREQLIETRGFERRYLDPNDIDYDATDGTPEVDGFSVLSPAPPALSDVTILFNNIVGQWVNQSDPNEYLLIYVNGTFVGRAYEQGNQNAVVVPMATWNTFRNQPDWLHHSPEDLFGGADGWVEITVELGAGVGFDSNGVSSLGGLLVFYEMDRDMNDNGWLDDCVPDGDPSGPDTDGDGVSDQIDRSPNTIADPSLVDVYGQLLRVARFDADEDGDVDVNDFDLLDATARDVDSDGDADLHDFASILQGARGPGLAADPAFLQELQLYKAHTFGPEDLDIKPWYKPVPVEYVWYYDSTAQRWKISADTLFPAHISYDNVNERSRLMYGTHLATVDKTGASPLSQWQQIDQIHDLTAASGSAMSWIGMRWHPSETAFVWENGQIFDVYQGSQSAWVDSREIPGSSVFTPGQDDYYVFTIDRSEDVLVAEDYGWMNGDGETASLKDQFIKGFVAQLPDNTVPAAPVTTTETVTVTLDSTLDGLTVAPGQTVDWTISFEVSSGDNSGLALLVTDLAQDAGNPASFDLPAGSAPAAMQNFAAPLGFTGPGGFGGQQTGTAGALDLAQIGGAQNSLGGASSDTSQGQGTTVVSGLGQSGSTVLASGSFTAPATVGTYTFNLANTLASVLKSVGGAGEGSETVPANLTLAQSSITIEVSNPPVITLLGDDPVTHEAATPYTDAGATASDLEDGDLTGSIVVSNPVNVAVPDTYTVTYTATDSDGESSTATRTVHVVDTTPPVITLNGDASVTHEAGTPYTDDVAAGDTLDGDLAGSLVVTNPVDAGTLGTYTVTYEVEDAAGNTATPVQRTVEVVDTTAPVITLLGANPVNMNAGETFTDPGFTALDSFEGDLGTSVTVSGTVNTLVHGNNVLTYNVTDGSGNAATPVTRTVFVDGPEPPEFAEATVAVSVEETTTGVIHRASADDPDGGVRFDHPGYVALFLTDEGTGAGATDALGSGLGLSFNAARWAVEPGAPGGGNVLGTQVLGDRSWFTVDNFNVTNGLTISEWIRFDDIQTSIYDPLIWKFGDLRVAAVNGQFGVVGPEGIFTATPFVDGEWAHLIFSIDADGNATFYLNGGEILSGQVPFDSSLTGNIFGHDFNTTLDGLGGARSDLTIIDGALSETQAEMLYQSALRGHQGDVLRYSLGTAGDEAFFSIDAYTGELSLASPLTHEDLADADGDNVYLVEVIAADSGGLSSSQIVEVTLNNSNVAPVITGTPVDPIPEVSGYYVYDFTVADADTLPADLTFQLTDNRFTVSGDGADGYRVHRLISHRFDYETQQDYDFDLIVSDGVEEDRVNLAFSLVNINDNAPVVGFTSAGPITENVPGAVLGVIDVTDPDGDTTFYYDFDPRFELAADGRTLKLKDGVALDYETQISLSVGIIVSDRPFSDGSANQTGTDATIPVINVNDVAPSNIQLTGLQVSENDPGAVVGTLSADDADGPGLSFAVSDARFEVDGDTLKLKDGVALDREATPSVTLTVTASDGTLDDTQDFTITVLNVDEGAPANLALSNASIAENTTGIVGLLTATDVDGDVITFSVTDGRFLVIGDALELLVPLNHESLADGTVALEVTASAGGASTTETFLITIEDVNEAPTLTLMADTIPLNGSNYPLTVLENLRQATLANSGAPGETQYPLSFQANDVDEDLLTWVLTGADAAAFTVDAATGALNFVTPADFENPADANGDGVYEVAVSVTDGELASNTIALTLTILDTVDEPYDTWAADRGLTPGINDDPDDDPDGDGCLNWQEFAFDGNPLSGTKGGKKRLGMVMVEDVEHLALTIPVRSGAVFSGSPSATASVDGISYTIQGTSNLADWTLPVIEVIPADSEGLPALNSGWEYRTFVVDSSRQNAFLRIGVQ